MSFLELRWKAVSIQCVSCQESHLGPYSPSLLGREIMILNEYLKQVPSEMEVNLENPEDSSKLIRRAKCYFQEHRAPKDIQRYLHQMGPPVVKSLDLLERTISLEKGIFVCWEGKEYVWDGLRWRMLA